MWRWGRWVCGVECLVGVLDGVCVLWGILGGGVDGVCVQCVVQCDLPPQDHFWRFEFDLINLSQTN